MNITAPAVMLELVVKRFPLSDFCTLPKIRIGGNLLIVDYFSDSCLMRALGLIQHCGHFDRLSDPHQAVPNSSVSKFSVTKPYAVTELVEVPQGQTKR